MAKIKKITLSKYESEKTNTIYYGYNIKDAQTKEIEGIKYIEVTPSLIRPKQLWIKFDSLREIGTVQIDPQ